MAKLEQTTGEAAISLIAPGTKIVGDCETDGTIRVEGQVEGTLKAGKSIVVGRSGEVVGDIITQDCVVSGRVSGNVTAESRLELQSTCDIQGEIPSSATTVDDDTVRVDVGQVLDVLDSRQRVGQRHRRLGIDVSTAVGDHSDDIACHQEPRRICTEGNLPEHLSRQSRQTTVDHNHSRKRALAWWLP